MKVIKQPNFTCAYCNANIAFSPKEIKTKKRIENIANFVIPGKVSEFEIETSYLVCPCCGTEHVLKETKKHID